MVLQLRVIICPPVISFFFEQQGWTPAYFLGQASRIGPAVNHFMNEVLKSRAYTEQTYNACRGIMRLYNEYGSTRLQAACTRALKGSVFTYNTIKSILINKLDQEDLTSPGELFRLPEHSNLRGPAAYQ